MNKADFKYWSNYPPANIAEDNHGHKFPKTFATKVSDLDNYFKQTNTPPDNQININQIISLSKQNTRRRLFSPKFIAEELEKLRI